MAYQSQASTFAAGIVPYAHATRSAAAPERAGRPAGNAASDEILVARVAAGDRLAIQLLVSRHQQTVYRFVLRLVGNSAAAEDIVSEVFIDLWRQAARVEGRSQLATWLLAIAPNQRRS